MAPHSSTLAWKIPWMRSLVGCSPWGHEESDMTDRLHFHFSLSCTGEGNGNPLVFLPGESQGQGSLVGYSPWGHRVGHNWTTKRRRQWHPTLILLPGKSHGQRSQVGCSPWGRKELDTTERLTVTLRSTYFHGFTNVHGKFIKFFSRRLFTLESTFFIF